MDDTVAPNRHLVYFDLVSERGEASVAQRVSALNPEHHEADAIILRASHNIDGDELRAAVAALTVPVWGLFRATVPLALQPLNAAAVSGPAPVALPVLRGAELRYLLHSSHALHAEPGHHYVLPSGLHTDTFIHVGTLLSAYPDVYRVADWLEEYIDEHTVLLADTGTLLPLLIELQTRTLERRHYRPGLHVFDAYPHTILEVQEMVRTIQSRTDARILFVLSVSSTGTLATWVEAAAAPDVTVVAVCDTARVPHEHALLHLPVQHIQHERADECEERRIGINPKTLERIYEPEYETVAIDRGVARRYAGFWEIADRTGAIYVHADRRYWADSTGVRHHPIYIDIAALLTDQKFRAECIEKLRAITPRPDLLIIPNHGDAHGDVRALVTEALGDLPTITTQGTQWHPDSAGHLDNARSILIADDALVTGRTIAGLRRAVYAHIQSRSDGGKVQVFGFVVIERPPTNLARSMARNPFVIPKNLVAGITVYLPRPTRKRCPWCRERRLLTLFAEFLSGEALDYADRRVERLKQGFLVPPIPLGTEGRLQPDAVIVNSFFGDLHHPAAVGAVSHAITAMQENELVDHGALRRVFKASSGLSFYDSVIMGTIFRMLRSRDVHWSGETGAVTTALAEYDPRSALPGYFAEVGFAALEGKLPRGPVEDALNSINNDPAVTLIKQIFSARPERAQGDLTTHETFAT